MALKVSYDNPQMMKGVEVELIGIGMIPNGGSVTVEESQEQQFMLERRETIKDAFKNNEMIKVEGASTITGGVKSVLGVDPDKLEITDTAPVNEDSYDRSAATSIGESIYDEPATISDFNEPEKEVSK